MVKSMTGFSRHELTENSTKILVEVRSLNGKNLEVSTRLPKNLFQHEIDIREMTRSFLERGSVAVNVTVETAQSEGKEIGFNEELAEAYLAALNKMRKKFKIREAVSIENLLQFKDIFETSTQEEEDSEETWKLVQKAIRAALLNLDNMRKNEGRELGKDIRNRLRNIEEDLDKVEKIAMQRMPQERDRLRQKVAKLFESDEIDEQRLQLEIVLLANKLDISEECVRLRSHIKYFVEVMNAKESGGRKMNFLLQEMNREVNTIGSKADDSEISQTVVRMKEEIERMREQVQNVE